VGPDGDAQRELGDDRRDAQPRRKPERERRRERDRRDREQVDELQLHGRLGPARGGGVTAAGARLTIARSRVTPRPPAATWHVNPKEENARWPT